MLALSKKPATSPNRPDNFPSPLLRINGGDKSRGRSRSNPIFYTRRMRVNSARVVVEPTQEPSSPNVTCIGQVRGSRSSVIRRPCWLIEKTGALFSEFRWEGFGRGFLFSRPDRRRSDRAEVAPGEYFYPPENSVILSRCRFDPYKPSSLGGLFWGSSSSSVV